MLPHRQRIFRQNCEHLGRIQAGPAPETHDAIYAWIMPHELEGGIREVVVGSAPEKVWLRMPASHNALSVGFIIALFCTKASVTSSGCVQLSLRSTSGSCRQTTAPIFIVCGMKIVAAAKEGSGHKPLSSRNRTLL